MSVDNGGFPAVTPPTQNDAFQILRPSKESTTALINDGERPTSAPAKLDKRKVRPGSYQALGLSAPICAALQTAGYNFPTPIQRKVIPHILAGDDMVAMARTGSGKTAAFLAPLLHHLSEKPQLMTRASRSNGPRALVVAPTRELVLQELKFCNLYSKRLEPRVRSAVVVGGTPLEAQFEALAVCPDIIFATPGRLLQLLAEMGARGGLTLTTTEILVFDEADRLFEGTLAVETAALINNLHDKTTEALGARQTILVSATMPLALAEFSQTRLRKNLTVVRLDADKSMSPTVAVAFLSLRADIEKDASLIIVARRFIDEGRSAVIFAATHRRVEYLTDLLRRCLTKSVGCIHGSMDQPARQETVTNFRKRRLSILVVTDVAARGIDLPDLDVVINYDMPATPKLFIHRVGRVGRAGKFGSAINMVAADELPYMLDVFLYLGRTVRFAEPTSRMEPHETLSSHEFCMDTSFVFGALPKAVIDEEVESTRLAIQDVELGKAYSVAKNAHKLYMKTRSSPGGESVRRAKELLVNDEKGRRAVHIHPWFADMEKNTEKDVTEQISHVSTWRPKECAVPAPKSLLFRKEVAKEKERDVMEFENNERHDEVTTDHDHLGKPAPKSKDIRKSVPEKVKFSARQVAMEEERRNFFLPTQQDAHQQQTEKAMKVGTGGSMGANLSAFRELRAAAMDVNADSNVDLLRSKHTGGTTAKYWDRVTKKFVKGGVTNTTSKRNLHVATREAKARANSGQNYATEDGALFKRWLRKNRKAVEELTEQVEEGTVGGPTQFGNGLGKNDYRRGAFGRKSRIVAAARNKASGVSNETNGKQARSELKTVGEIKKARKLKSKTEARRQGHQMKKHTYKAPQRGVSKSRVIIRKH